MASGELLALQKAIEVAREAVLEGDGDGLRSEGRWLTSEVGMIYFWRSICLLSEVGMITLP